jgi:hypothetical protein
MVLLSVKNAHKRDSRVTFVDETHSYYLDDEWKFPLSCTGFCHRNFGHFNADDIIKKMMRSKKWNENKYYGMTPNEIKKLWDDNRDQAASMGTLMHNTIEDFYNLETEEERVNFSWDPRIEKEKEYFMIFYNDHKHLKPYRTEMIVWSKEEELAGSIDMLFINEGTGELSIFDWKRSKEIRYENKYQKGFGPCSHFDDCNYYHYSLQLNFYKYLLETYYQFKVKDLHLAVFHPLNESYIKIQVNDYQQEIKDMLDVWRDDRNGIKTTNVTCLFEDD